MNTKANAVLSQMVDQFRQRHQRPPDKVVLAPLACLALAVKQSLAPTWNGIPVECREIAEHEATKDRSLVKSLAVFVLPEDRTGRLVSCDLKT
jgi:hypothetical protein